MSSIYDGKQRLQKNKNGSGARFRLPPTDQLSFLIRNSFYDEGPTECPLGSKLGFVYNPRRHIVEMGGSV